MVKGMSNILVHDSIVVAITSEDKSNNWYLTGISTNTGKFKWKWNEIITQEEWLLQPNINVNSKGIFKFAIKYKSANTEVYGIDLMTGKKNWTIQRGIPWNVDFEAHNGFVYTTYVDISANQDTSKLETVYQIDPLTGAYDGICNLKLDSVDDRLGIYGQFKGLQVFGDELNEFWFSPYTQLQPNDSTWGDCFLALYDITNREYIYDSIPLIGRVRSFGPTTTYNNRLAFINAAEHVFGIDIMTGEIIWDTGLIDQGGFSLHVVDDILIMGQYRGSVSYMYGKDPESGQTLWRTENGGGAEELQSHNGIVYWADRGDGKLWAMEAKTGEVLWKINRPDPESDSWFVHGKLGILPGENGEKGKLFASTYRRLYCYELIR